MALMSCGQRNSAQDHTQLLNMENANQGLKAEVARLNAENAQLKAALAGRSQPKLPANPPTKNVPVPADHVARPGDELIIRAWGQIDMNLRLIVDRNGAINMPQVGVLQVAGLKATELEDFIKAQVSRLFKGFEMKVTFGRVRED
jgi:protein involved in polysaccharide export with SLBB domain